MHLGYNLGAKVSSQEVLGSIGCTLFENKDGTPQKDGRFDRFVVVFLFSKRRLLFFFRSIHVFCFSGGGVYCMCPWNFDTGLI